MEEIKQKLNKILPKFANSNTL